MKTRLIIFCHTVSRIKILMHIAGSPQMDSRQDELVQHLLLSISLS